MLQKHATEDISLVQQYPHASFVLSNVWPGSCTEDYFRLVTKDGNPRGILANPFFGEQFFRWSN